MKTYFKYTFLLLFINTAFSQLTVRNSAYIYVTDEVVFVEDDISLKESNSMFYLRDDAQLIQGVGTTGNTGVGQLSVFQSGTVDNYAYNYWASPVGNVDSDNSNNRQFRMSGTMFDWTGSATPSLHQITSTPSAFTGGFDGTASPLTISDKWLYQFAPGTDYSDWIYVGSTGTLHAGRGFSMKGTTGSAGQLYDFRGKPYKGDIFTPVLTGNFTLVGNPYPSALDVATYIHDPTNSANITGTLHFWHHDPSVNSHYIADYVGGYATLTMASDGSMRSFIKARFDTYNSDGTLSTTGSTTSSPKELYRYLPIGQGFMIEGSNNGNAVFRNSHRAYNTNFTTLSNTVFRTNPNATSVENEENSTNLRFDENGVHIIPDDYKRFRLNVDFNDTYSNELILNFHESATEGFDYGLEILQAIDEKAEVYFKNPNDAHHILAQAHNFNRDLRIPLVFELTEQKPIRVRIDDIQNFDEDQEIYLHDITSDFYYNLREVNFEATIESGIYNSEYEITFRNFNTLDTSEFDIDNFSIFQNNKASNLIVLNPSNLTIKGLSVYDVIGKRVLQKTNLNNDSRYEFSTSNLSDGTYIVKVSLDQNNKAINKKIIIQNKK